MKVPLRLRDVDVVFSIAFHLPLAHLPLARHAATIDKMGAPRGGTQGLADLQIFCMNYESRINIAACYSYAYCHTI